MLILGFILFLFAAAACTYLAKRYVPGLLLDDFITSVVAGIIGAWAGNNLIGQFGPNLAGVSLIPCMLGSAILVYVVSLVSQTFPNRGVFSMNWDQIKGDWKQIQGKVKAKWGKLTDNDLMQIGGKKDELVGKLQEHYGHNKEQAEKHIDEFIKNI